MLPRILFVDDDNNLIQGLKRSLRNQSRGWEMVFCTEATEALVKMQETCFDVVVSDMRMPQMDGAQLLSEVSEKCPSSVRFVLSGQADDQTILRCLPVAHQHIAKPCDVEGLINKIDRVCSAKILLPIPELRADITRLRSIPIASDTLIRLKEELLSASPSILIISELASTDPGLGLKLLQLVNSSFFGHPEEMISPDKAARRIGVSRLRSVVLGSKLFEEAVLKTNFQSQVDYLFMALAMEDDLDHTDQFTIFTRHIAEFGKSLTAQLWPDKYQSIIKLTDNGYDQLRAETQVLGCGCKAISLYLMSIWGLPESIINSVADQTISTEGCESICVRH